MDLTSANKAHIDSLSYKSLLSRWRFAPMDDLWFQGETGDYWGERMKELRNNMNNSEHVRTSKSIGWKG